MLDTQPSSANRLYFLFCNISKCFIEEFLNWLVHYAESFVILGCRPNASYDIHLKVTQSIPPSIAAILGSYFYSRELRLKSLTIISFGSCPSAGRNGILMVRGTSGSVPAASSHQLRSFGKTFISGVSWKHQHISGRLSVVSRVSHSDIDRQLRGVTQQEACSLAESHVQAPLLPCSSVHLSYKWAWVLQLPVCIICHFYERLSLRYEGIMI